MTLRFLLEQTRNEEATIRRAAVRELAGFDCDESVVALVACLQDPSLGVVDAAVHSLIEVGTPGVAASLTPLLTHSEIGQRSLALDVLMALGRVAGPAMAGLLTHDDRELRKSASEVLTESGYTEAGPALVARISDPDPVVRAAVAAALGGLRYEPALPELIRQWRAESEEWAKFSLASVICGLATTAQVQGLVAEAAPGPLREMMEAELDLRMNGGEQP